MGGGSSKELLRERPGRYADMTRVATGALLSCCRSQQACNTTQWWQTDVHQAHLGARDVPDHDGRAGVAAAIALNPAVLC